jgi:hypothetical protein
MSSSPARAERGDGVEGCEKGGRVSKERKYQTRDNTQSRGDAREKKNVCVFG